VGVVRLSLDPIGQGMTNTRDSPIRLTGQIPKKTDGGRFCHYLPTAHPALARIWMSLSHLTFKSVALCRMQIALFFALAEKRPRGSPDGTATAAFAEKKDSASGCWIVLAVIGVGPSTSTGNGWTTHPGCSTQPAATI
jgi:hypothetical protein